MQTLLSEWIIQALLRGQSNLQILMHQATPTFLSWFMGPFLSLVKLLEHYGVFHDRMISQHATHTTSKEWIGLYKNQEDKLLEWVVSASYLRNLVSVQSNLVLRLWALSVNPLLGRNILPLVKLNHMLRMWNLPHHLRVDVTSQDGQSFTWQCQTQFNLFFGKLDQLFF